MAWELDGTPIGDALPFNGGPPRHFNCRSTLIPVLRSFEELGLGKTKLDSIPPGTRASMDGQIAADTTFAQWLGTKTPAFQDKLLGPARAKLWRGNKITLNQLVDMRGNPMTVEQLLELSRKKRVKAATPAAATPVAAPPPTEVEPWEGVPEFKKPKDAEDWLRANAVNRQGKYATAKLESTGATKDVSVALVNSWNRAGLRIMASVTKMMERRFGMTLPNYIGSPSKHPQYNFKKSKALAAVHMESDSLLSQAGGVDVNRVVKSAPNVQRYVQHNIESKRRIAKNMLEEAREFDDPALLKAIEGYIDDDTFEFTLGDVGIETNGLANIWRTWIHESGHRFHAHWQDEINGILAKEFTPGARTKARGTDAGQMKRRYLWFKQTSEYAMTNNFEFIAEQFSAYMQGKHERVLPSLLKFFKEKDKGGKFGPPPELEP
jgi:hypothetical protein